MFLLLSFKRLCAAFHCHGTLPSFIKKCSNFSLTSLACLEEFLLVDGYKSSHVPLGASSLQSPGITVPHPSSKSIRLGEM